MKIATALVIVSVCLSTLIYGQTNNEVINMHALSDFNVLTREGQASNRKPYGPFHPEKDLNALAGDDLNYTFQMASAEGTFTGPAGKYTVCLNTLTERDGECVYNVYINDVRVGLFQQNPPTNEFTAPATLTWTGVQVPAHAKIRVESNNGSNLKRHEGNFYEYARGRWTGIDFIPQGENTASDLKGSLGIFEKLDLTGPFNSSPVAICNTQELAYYLSLPDDPSVNDKNVTAFLWKHAKGDFELEALVTPVIQSGNNNLNGGLMIRESTEADSPFIACALTGDGKIIVQVREERGGAVRENSFSYDQSEMVEVIKNDNNVSISIAPLGNDYSRDVIKLTGFRDSLMAGFFTGSGATVRFSNVRFFEDTNGKSKE
jgi:hypothetical protein